MKVAICGAGLRSTKVLNYLKHAMPEMTFVGYYDPQPSLLSDIFDPREIKRFESVEAMLSDASPDLLFVGSPNHVHCEQIELGLNAGVRVFTEKPVVTDLAQTWRLVELLREYGPEKCMVGLVLRYSPQIIDLQDALSEGLLGDIVSMEANGHIEPSHGAFFMRDWRRYRQYSGGYMLEKCVHDIDLYNLITNSRPKKVASFGGRNSFIPKNTPTHTDELELVHSKTSIWQSMNDPYGSDADIVDHQTALLSFENKVSMTFHTNLNIPDQQRRFMVAGSKGMAEGDFKRGFMKITASPSGKTLFGCDYKAIPEANIDHYGADAKMARDIACYLRDGSESLPVSIVDALEAGIAAMAIDQARESGEVVDLTKTWAQFDSYRLRD